MDDVVKSLAENQVVLLLVPKLKYNESVSSCLKVVSDEFDAVCYTSFNKPAGSVLQQAKKAQAAIDKFSFIDVLTGTVGEPEKNDKIIYVRSASALTDLGLAVNACSKDSGILIFDSIATLLIYNESQEVENFLHHVITKSRVANKKMLIISLSDDAQSELIKDLYVFVDDVVEVKA